MNFSQLEGTANRLRRLRDHLSLGSPSPIEIVRGAAALLAGEDLETERYLREVVSELDDVPSDSTPSLWEPEFYLKKRKDSEDYLLSQKESILEKLDQVINEIDPPRDIAKCIDQWSNFVEAVREGYDLYLDEYDNDLSIRSTIESLVRDGKATSEMCKRLAEVDQEFIKLTYEDEMRSKRGREWWEKRFPLNPAGLLKEDIDAGSR